MSKMTKCFYAMLVEEILERYGDVPNYESLEDATIKCVDCDAESVKQGFSGCYVPGNRERARETAEGYREQIQARGEEGLMCV